MSEINRRIHLATKNAIVHSVTCEKLIMNNDLKGAIAYCEQQNLEPPQCSLTAASPNAEKMRLIAARMLSETKWWTKRLKNQSIQQFEHELISKGFVTNGISDETLKYHLANKR
jgi:hypothetical protein